MGYTHKWRHTLIDNHAWDQICEDVSKLIKASSVKVQFEDDDDRPPLIWKSSKILRDARDGVIRFNGVGDDGHETFYLTQDGRNGFNFCKTARKPYDLLVAATLAVIRYRTSKITVTSDGDLDDQEWVDALKFASDTLGREIKYPVEQENT